MYRYRLNMEKSGTPVIQSQHKGSSSNASDRVRAQKLSDGVLRHANSFDFARHAILLDIDGTLLDLAPTPAGVLVPSSLQGTLTTLWKWTSGALALVSGRPLADIDGIFAPLELPAIGGHGAEIRPTVTEEQVLRRDVPLLEERLRRQLLGLATRGVYIEDKGYSIAVHYRGARELGPTLHKAVAGITAGLATGAYEVLPGKFVIEVKPTGFNKGTAVLELMEIPPFRGRKPIFIGDDITDESVFAILADVKGTGISVGRLIPGVSGMFNAPAEVRAWLDRLANRIVEK
jgi:trehalose 6-phosphate phosphatase